MTQKIDEAVSVAMTFDCKVRKAVPKSIVWNNRLYPITKIGFHHAFRTGKTLYHVFSVATPTLFFRLVLDTENLHWKATDISDASI